MTLKRRLYLYISHNNFLKVFLNIAIKINLLLFHWSERQQVLHRGILNPDKKFYIIRPRGMTEGLLSMYSWVTHFSKWCLLNGYEPYIDFEKNPCQYNVDREINGTHNAWEYFFCQPSRYSRETVYKSKNVTVSGWTLFEKKNSFNKDIELFSDAKEYKCYITQYYNVQPYIYKLVDDKRKEIFGNDKILGVFLRGTDYVRLKPKGHHIQPSVEEIEFKINEFLSKYKIDRIFVVTEDIDIFNTLKKDYGNMIFSSDDNFVASKNIDYISEMFRDDAYERGLKYLIRLLLLTKCDYLITSLASGSMFAMNIKEDSYIDSYIFDIGLYQ